VTITITKLRLAIAVIAIAVLAPATTAFATHVFGDVADDRFYSDAVEWAFDNNITTGTSATTFEPDANVTRGQNVTFAKRYDDNIVQPALTTLTGSTTTNAAAITELEGRTSSHFLLGLGDGGLLNTSYPGATVSRFDEGVYIVTFPGLEIFDFSDPTAEVFCATQSTTIEDNASGSAVTFNDDVGADTSQVIVFTFLPDGTLNDTAFSLTLTC
jgi:hypothetical protein